MFRPIRTDPPANLVRRITFVPFLADGRCVLIDEPAGPALPSGEVLDGEDYLLDTVLRVPLETAGFRYQRFHPFGLDRDHLYAWIEGGPRTGGKPHRTAVLSFCSAKEAVRRLDEPSSPTVSTYRLRWPNSPAGGCPSGTPASGPATPWSGARPSGCASTPYTSCSTACPGRAGPTWSGTT